MFVVDMYICAYEMRYEVVALTKEGEDVSCGETRTSCSATSLDYWFYKKRAQTLVN